ncbi:helix-turn-helix transcriptional regulator [Anaerobutyricum hallii]|uniref:helix-turn-helix transcriptional regulator n=1 Tax=Anaerobutyricum hallii TaxID=39488 RepID=UPI003520472C
MSLTILRPLALLLFTVQSVLPEAAQKIGVSTDTLGNYERGKSYPDIPILRKIESVYGVPYDRLIFLSLDFGLTEKRTEKPERKSS